MAEDATNITPHDDDEHRHFALAKKCIEEVRKAIGTLWPLAVDAAGQYVKSKGEIELGRAAEIKSKIVERIQRTEIDAQRADHEAKRVANEQHCHELECRAQMMGKRADLIRAKAEALKTLVEAVESLKQLGVQVNVTLLAKTAEGVAREIKK